jgi:uncharacterized protein (DUF302 family)
MATEGLITVPSSFTAGQTADRLAVEIIARGLTVFARVDHAAGAAEVGLSMRPTELLIFGNARGGTPLMQAQQTIGIDLPLKALVFEDEAGRTWLAYNDPHWLGQRHRITAAVAPLIQAMAAALNAVAEKATTASKPVER